MDSASPLLALRLCGQEHALEPNRDYLLGSAADCDLRLPAAAAHHARLVVTGTGVELVDLGTPAGTRCNGERVDRRQLAVGDGLRFGDGEVEAFVVRDLGTAAIVPLPAMRQARAFTAVRVAAAALRQEGGETLQQAMARELRRAPWFALSLLAHALLLLVLWACLPDHTPSGRNRATVNIDLAGQLPAAAEGPPTPPEIVIEPTDPTIDPPATPTPPAPAEDRPAREAEGAAPRPSLPQENARLGARASPSSSAPHIGGGNDVGGLGSGGFRQTVSDLRKSGLEIVFVFDSTGSMTRTIQDTKATIAQMLAVLRALVPDARIGLVTYRDRDNREEYIVRQMPLGLDYWRAANFVQFITAEGGGDRPEDVRAGLRAAFQQSWRNDARRVVVLAGDAPPHATDMSRVLSETRAFVANGRSFVHTLVTSPQEAGADTREAFTEIAQAGKGICQGMDSRDRVLQRVLTLAFGREFSEDMATVIAQVQRDEDRVDVQSLALARRGGVDLARALRQTPVPQELWNALVRRPHRAVTNQLIEILAAGETPEPTRHAVAAALQRILELPLPPIDPLADAITPNRMLGQLRMLAARLPE